MFGMRGHRGQRGECGDGMWAGGRGRRMFGHHGGGEGGGRGFGGGDMMRAGRMLAHGDLRLVALTLIAEQPRHGYEIIKLIEEKTAGWYSPSPGVVYPTLTYLEEAGYVTVETEGTKKLYTITPEGRAYIEENRSIVDAILGRLFAIGEKMARVNRAFGGDRERSSRLPALVHAALDNLREVAGHKIDGDAEAETQIVEILARAAAEIRRG
ncbi:MULTISPECIES: PadR family transcriptional regulator [unclassified Inquilinus]|uniref:PadR family transcriptional regulator n=1 Tax=unclassified Inquilinus TaxID=2645927 RepID=UPI003F8FA02F